MIVIPIWLYPKGSRKHKRKIGRIVITNDGTGTVKLGNYSYTLSHAGMFFGRRKDPFKKGELRGFPRVLSPYRLLARVLKDARET